MSAFVGALASVGVAWGIAAWYQTRSPGAIGSGPWIEVDHSSLWRPDAYDDNMMLVDASSQQMFGFELRIGAWVVDSPGLGVRNGYTAAQVRYGWPCRSASFQAAQYPPTATGGWHRPPIPKPRVEGGIEVSPPGLSGPLVLPTTIRWPGFAVNAALYAGVCWALLMTSGVVVRWRRRRRGRCPACGYELGELATCPECGRERS